MVSLHPSSSGASSLRSASPDGLANNNANVRTSPLSNASNSGGSASSSGHVSSRSDDEENVTITANRTLGKRKGKRKSQEDLQFLAVSTRITELSYSISDIQTRIFEIQELRHKSQSSSDAASATGATNTIDQSLMNLDERLEAVAQGVKSVSDALTPLMSQKQTTYTEEGHSGEGGVILRKHAALMAEWEAVQRESDTLRDELKEDKWLIVFRTVTEQAGGLMTSLEKGVNRCQDFITQVYQRRSEDLTLLTSLHSEKTPPNLESYMTLLQSYAAKKKHYVPAITKVLSVLDKGAQDRVTKNGECLRRHAESTQRWQKLQDRIHRTDDEMERVRRVLQYDDFAPSENGSNASGKTSMSKNGYLGVSSSGNGSGSIIKTPSSLSRSMSPFRKLARKIKGSPKTPTMSTPALKRNPSREPVSEPVRTLRHRPSFTHRGLIPVTPERAGHKYSQSLSPDAVAMMQSRRTDLGPTVTGRPKWNSSTRVEGEERTGTVKLRPPMSDSMSPSISGTMSVSTSGGSPYSRSLSRTSLSSSRPWSPIASSAASTTQSTLSNRPPSRMRPSSRIGQTVRPPSRSQMQTPGPSTVSPPRSRPKTPSHIPAPSTQWRTMFDDGDSVSSLVRRAFSPTFSSSAASTSGRETPSNSLVPAPRPPSRSMIPIPTLKFSSASRPSSSMSNYSESPEASYRRAQTPESTLRQRVLQLPLYQDARATPRPSLHKVPPSSFRDGLPKTPTSRPGSRAASHVPVDHNAHIYVPASSKDPLDIEVAHVVNSTPHGLLVERVDPPLRTAPKGGEEVRAQYAVSNALARKVITCRLTTLTRPSAKGSGQSPTTTKKVMCRVGGGWQDLQIYILNRQAGI